jgi:carbamoylphosphate synthase large subunit
MTVRPDDVPLTLIAPDSLAAWYPCFAGRFTDTLAIGERSGDADAIIRQVLAQRPRRVRILSGHDSLRRDLRLADDLRDRGLRVDSQSARAVEIGLDKLAQKDVFGQVGLGVPTWGEGASAPGTGVHAIQKAVDSTQSRDVRPYSPTGAVLAGAYWEEFIDGVEYSVVVYSSAAGQVTFPPVWKGRSRADLTPPWMRLRLVPSPLEPAVSRRLMALAVEVAAAIDNWGFMELEVVVDGTGRIFGIEINPRICGTMRISAMATEVEIFDAYEMASLGSAMLTGVRYAAEVPYAGPAFQSRHAVASSRLTVSGASREEVRQRMGEHGIQLSPAEWDVGWP